MEYYHTKQVQLAGERQYADAIKEHEKKKKKESHQKNHARLKLSKD